MSPFFLIKRLAAFAALVFVVSIAVLWVLIRVGALFEDSRLAMLSANVRTLSELQSPKLVLIGGSNLPYGMNSEMLSEAMGMPVVNMGAQASLTLEFLLELVKPHLHSGDVIIFGFEYIMYTSNEWSTSTLIRAAATDIRKIRFMNWRQVVAAPLYLFPAISVQGQELWQSIGRYLYEKPSYADGLTSSGDYIGHRGKPSTYVTEEANTNNEYQAAMNQAKMDYLDGFRDYCDKRGVQIYVSFAPVARDSVNWQVVHAIATSLAEKFTVISDPLDYAFPDSDFYDTQYHLVYDMRDVRTRQLIDDLLRNVE